MSECVRLGIRPYPQKYVPLNITSRKTNFIGKYWTRKLANQFRFFWLMAGNYKKQSFGDFINTQALSKEDLSAWAVDADRWNAEGQGRSAATSD